MGVSRDGGGGAMVVQPGGGDFRPQSAEMQPGRGCEQDLAVPQIGPEGFETGQQVRGSGMMLETRLEAAQIGDGPLERGLAMTQRFGRRPQETGLHQPQFTVGLFQQVAEVAGHLLLPADSCKPSWTSALPTRCGSTA